MDHGSGQISDGVSILFLMYTFLYHKVICYRNNSEQNNSHERSTSGLKIPQIQFNIHFILVYT